MSNKNNNNSTKEESRDIYIYKVILLGDTKVGKTSFLLRFCDDSFVPNAITTIGIDNKTKFLLHNNKKVKLEIWDTAGQERFRSITKNCFKGADGIILMFDFENKQSFLNIKTWISSIKEALDLKNVGLVLIGNKSDIPDEMRSVTKENIDKIVTTYKLKYFSASAKNNVNVNEAFVNLLDQMMALDDGSKYITKRKRTKLDKIEIDDDEEKERKSGCCGKK